MAGVRLLLFSSSVEQLTASAGKLGVAGPDEALVTDVDCGALLLVVELVALVELEPELPLAVGEDEVLEELPAADFLSSLWFIPHAIAASAIAARTAQLTSSAISGVRFFDLEALRDPLPPSSA